MLNEFKSFEKEVYFAIILSLLIISSITGLYENSLKIFFKTVWGYLSVILSDYLYMRKYISYERSIAGGWLLSCTILLAAFSGKLLNNVLKPKEYKMINNWEDLYERKELRIQAPPYSQFASYVNNFRNESMAQSFYERTDFWYNGIN